MTRVSLNSAHRIRQGDIFQNIEYLESFVEREGAAKVTKIRFPLSIVLTQDCDLKWHPSSQAAQDDKTDNAVLVSVLMVPMYNAEHFKLGEHLSKLELSMQRWNSDEFKKIKKNLNPRYHYFHPGREDTRLVPTILDFKHYFSVRYDLLTDIYGNAFLCSVEPLYREDIAQRFASFLSRIALPEE